VLDGHSIVSDLTAAIAVLALFVVFEKRVMAAIRAGKAVLAELGLFKKARCELLTTNWVRPVSRLGRGGDREPPVALRVCRFWRIDALAGAGLVDPTLVDVEGNPERVRHPVGDGAEVFGGHCAIL
jgi:hypothetical protein